LKSPDAQKSRFHARMEASSRIDSARLSCLAMVLKGCDDFHAKLFKFLYRCATDFKFPRRFINVMALQPLITSVENAIYKAFIISLSLQTPYLIEPAISYLGIYTEHFNL